MLMEHDIRQLGGNSLPTAGIDAAITAVLFQDWTNILWKMQKEETQAGTEESQFSLEGKCFERRVKHLKCTEGKRKIEVGTLKACSLCSNQGTFSRCTGLAALKQQGKYTARYVRSCLQSHKTNKSSKQQKKSKKERKKEGGEGERGRERKEEERALLTCSSWPSLPPPSFSSSPYPYSPHQNLPQRGNSQVLTDC